MRRCQGRYPISSNCSDIHRQRFRSVRSSIPRFAACRSLPRARLALWDENEKPPRAASLPSPFARVGPARPGRAPEDGFPGMVREPHRG